MKNRSVPISCLKMHKTLCEGKMKKLFLSLLLLSPAVGYCGGSSGARYLKNVSIEGTTWIMITPTEAFANPDQCGRSDVVIVPFADPTHDAKLSVALSALMGKQKLNAYFNGCITTHWGFSVPNVHMVGIGE